jgi:hypothetical protein
MRVVFGVHEEAPRQVSRMKTWRKPLFALGLELDDEVAAADFAAAVEPDCDVAWLGVTARNAMNRPDALTDGKMPSVPTSWPVGSVETSCVDAEHCDCVPAQVSRR